MNAKLTFSITENHQLFIDGIDFCNTIFVRPKINGIDIIENFYKNDCLAVASEWVDSSKKPGNYLLFTSLIGIADDGGWELQPVHHGNGIITVSIADASENKIDFCFSEKEYMFAIKKMEKDVAVIIARDNKKKLEPVHFSYPE